MKTYDFLSLAERKGGSLCSNVMLIHGIVDMYVRFNGRIIHK